MIVPFTQAEAAQLLQGSRDTYVDLFQKYFQTIAIKERTNKRLQDHYMPKRYREYMPETK
jgi:hypothetical protein